MTEPYRSQSARDAERSNYGTPRYWAYLDDHAQELYDKGILDAFTRTLGEALEGNNGD